MSNRDIIIAAEVLYDWNAAYHWDLVPMEIKHMFMTMFPTEAALLSHYLISDFYKLITICDFDHMDFERITYGNYLQLVKIIEGILINEPQRGENIRKDNNRAIKLFHNGDYELPVKQITKTIEIERIYDMLSGCIAANNVSLFIHINVNFLKQISRGIFDRKLIKSFGRYMIPANWKVWMDVVAKYSKLNYQLVFEGLVKCKNEAVIKEFLIMVDRTKLRNFVNLYAASIEGYGYICETVNKMEKEGLLSAPTVRDFLAAYRSGNRAIMERIIALDIQHRGWNRKSSLLNPLIKSGNIEGLRWVIPHIHLWDAGLSLDTAIVSGNRDMLDFVIKTNQEKNIVNKGFKADHRACEALAAKYKLEDILRLVGHAFPLVMTDIAFRKHKRFDCYEHLIKNKLIIEDPSRTIPKVYGPRIPHICHLASFGGYCPGMLEIYYSREDIWMMVCAAVDCELLYTDPDFIDIMETFMNMFSIVKIPMRLVRDAAPNIQKWVTEKFTKAGEIRKRKRED